MAVLQRPDARVSYHLAGSGTPVTLLHGFTQSSRAWRELLARMRNDHRWISVDIRGHGDTRTDRCASHSLDACAADVVAVWDAAGVDRSHLVGYSMGGRLALRIAVGHPSRLRSLCVIGAHAGLGDAERRERSVHDAVLAERIEREGARWFARHWAQLPLFASLRQRRADLAAELERERRSGTAPGLAASLRQAGAGAMPPLWNELGGVECPVLAVAGAEDTRYAAYAERLAAVLPSARVAMVEDAGHAAHLEQPDAVAALLDAFLAEVDARAGAG